MADEMMTLRILAGVTDRQGRLRSVSVIPALFVIAAPFRHPRESPSSPRKPVIPAKAGIHG